MTSTYTTLLTSLDRGVFTITMNRPDVFNACNEDLTMELQSAFRYAADDDAVRCVILTGAGRAFCSGQDLKDAPSGGGKRSLQDSLERRYNPIIRLIRELPKPVIAGINGVAAGAGLSLALGDDWDRDGQADLVTSSSPTGSSGLAIQAGVSLGGLMLVSGRSGELLREVSEVGYPLAGQ